GNARVEVFSNTGQYESQWAGFSSPSGVALDGAGNVYVSDDGNETVDVFTPQGAPLRSWDTVYGVVGAGAIAVDPASGDVYIADDFGEVGLFTNTGSFLGLAQGPEGGFASLKGIAVGSGVWAAADPGQGMVDLFQACSRTPLPTPTLTPTETRSPTETPTPTLSPTITLSPTETLSPTVTPTPQPYVSCPIQGMLAADDPQGLALDPSGDLYVADYSAGLIRVFDPQGDQSATLGGPSLLTFPFAVAADGTGKVYVTELGNDQIDVLDSQGGLLRQWSLTAGTDSQPAYPLGVAVDAAGATVYVSDAANQEIKYYDAQGNLLGAWGGDGTFNDLSGIALDGMGRVYAADGYTGLVHVFDGLGHPIAQWNATGLSAAYFIAVDPSGDRVYLTDGYGSMGVFGTDGTVIGATVPDPLVPGARGVAVGVGVVYVANNQVGEVDVLGPCMTSPAPTPTPMVNPGLVCAQAASWSVNFVGGL
ncbi:MAG TPA: NHL repeat-containing protein, partial [bacterium]|nr:NHL repeat-containing protein [bacterium]